MKWKCYPFKHFPIAISKIRMWWWNYDKRQKQGEALDQQQTEEWEASRWLLWPCTSRGKHTHHCWATRCYFSPSLYQRGYLMFNQWICDTFTTETVRALSIYCNAIMENAQAQQRSLCAHRFPRVSAGILKPFSLFCERETIPVNRFPSELHHRYCSLFFCPCF